MKAKGLMRLSGPALAKVVDDTVAALRLANPTWIGWYGDSLPAQVQQIILEGAANARRQTKQGEASGLYATGGIWIEYDPIAEATTVKVQLAYITDEEDDDYPDWGKGPNATER